jgi:uncharacterized repeat protein (TIGR01451 family)
VTKADVDAGSVTNIATAAATGPYANPVTSNPSSVTVNATEATSGLSVVTSTTSTGYGRAGDTVGYTYLVTNTGTTTLSGVGVNDTEVTSVSCPDTTLAPGASETCTGSYTVTQADVDAGSVTDSATAGATNPQSTTVTSSTSSVTVAASSAFDDLEVAVSTSSAGYGRAGDTIGYSYLVTNTGTTTESDVGVNDNLVASVSCPDTTLVPGASETCTGSYTVTQADVDAGSVTDSATAGATNPSHATVSSASSSVTVQASSAISGLSFATSTSSTGYGRAGDTIGYSYLVTNTGTTDLSAVSVNDPNVASISCPSGPLAPAAAVTCTGSYTVTQADVDAGSVTDTATASATNPQSLHVTSGASSLAVAASKATSTLSLATSTSSTGYGKAGDTIGFSYLATNTGTTTLSAVSVSDPKIASISCPSGPLAPAAAVTCTGTYTVTQADVDAGSVTDTATGHATNPQSAAVNSSLSSLTVEASQSTSTLSLATSTNSTGFSKTGNTIAFSYRVTNTGTTTLSAVSVSDPKIASIICPSGSLAPAAAEACYGRYTVTQADVDAGSVTDTATAHASNPQSLAVASGASSLTVAASKATSTLSLATSTTSTGFSRAGDTIAFSYRVTNTGSTTLSAVSVSDPKITSVSCPSGSLAPVAVLTCTGSYTVTQADVDAGSVTDTATAHATNPQSGAVTSGPSPLTVAASGATSSLLLSSTTSSTGYGKVGDTIGYSYLVTNSGTTTLSAASVTDPKIAISCPSGSLAPGVSVSCTGTYVVTQADVDGGSVTDTATAQATNPQSVHITSSPSSLTVEASKATSSLGIVESAVTAGYHATGNVIHYDSVVTNTGTTTLSGVAVTATKATGLSCPTTTLSPGVSEICTGAYTVTQADVSSGSVVNTAAAHAINPQALVVISVPSAVTVHATGLRITTPSPLRKATRSVSYSVTLAATGATGPFTWSVKSGSLPAGLTLSTSGSLSGKPTKAGMSTFTVEVKDRANATATAIFTLTVAP